MRRFALGFVLAVLAGCSASESMDAAGRPSGGAWNGQTGSLTPVCGLRAEQLSLQDSKRGFVVETGGCRTGIGPGGVSLLDEDGQPIEFSAVSLGDGKYLIVPSTALEPGAYSVSVDGSSRDVTIEEPAPAPVPTRAGDLERIAPSNCGLELALTLDPATLALAPLLRLTVSVDGFSNRYADYGELTSDDATIELACANNCVGPGRHVVEVVGEIAGQMSVLEKASVTVDVQCSDIEDNQGCSFSPGRGSRSWALVVMVVLGLSARRRSSARRESRGMKRGSSG